MGIARLKARKNPIAQGLALLRRLGDRASVFAPGVAQARGPVNLLWHSDLKTGVAYSFPGGNVTDAGVDAAATDPLGRPGARKWVVSSTSNNNRFGDTTSGTPQQWYTGALWIKTADGSTVSGGSADINDAGAYSLTPLNITPDWQLFAVQGFSTGNFRFLDFNLPVGSFHVYGSGLFAGTYTAAELLALGGIPLNAAPGVPQVAARYSHWISGAALAPDTPSRAIGPVNLSYPSVPTSTGGNGWTTVTPGYTTGPDGRPATRYAWTSTAACYVTGSVSSTNVAGAPYTAAILVKGNAANTVAKVAVAKGDSSQIAYANFNLTTKVLNQSSSGANVSGVSASFVDVGDGWFLIAVTGTFSTAYVSNFFSFLTTQAPNGDLSIAGLGLFQGAYTAAQLQATGGIPLTTTVPLPGYDGSGLAVGPNLINNAGPFTNTSGWGTYQSTVAAASGELILNQTLNSGGNTSFGVVVSPGQTYRVTATYRNISAANVTVFMQRGAAGSYANISGFMPNAGTSNTTNEIYFTAPASDAQVVFSTGGTVAGQQAALVSVSLQAVTTMPQAPWLMNYVESSAATAASVDGPVGFLSDGSGVVGPEKITSVIAQAATLVGDALTENATSNPHGIKFTSSTAATRSEFRFRLQAGTKNWIWAYFENYTGGSAWFDLATGTVGTQEPGVVGKITPSPQGGGWYDCTLVKFNAATSGSCNLFAVTANGSTANYAGTNSVAFRIASYSVVEISGRHATQGTGANKPVLRRGVVNVLLNSRTLGTGWTVNSGGVATPGAARGPDVDVYDATTVATTTSAGSGLYTGAGTFVAGELITQAVVVKRATGDSTRAMFGWDTGNGWLKYNPLTGAITGVGTAVTSYSSKALSNGYMLFAWQFVGVGTGVSFVVYNDDIGRSCVLAVHNTGTFRGAYTAEQLAALGGLPVTTTAAASSARGNYWLEFNGSTSFLSLGAVPLGLKEDHAVIVGSSAKVGETMTLFANSTAANHQLPWLRINDQGRVAVAYYDGTNFAGTADWQAAPPLVVAGLLKRSNYGYLRRNGLTVGVTQDMSLLNSTADTSTMGGFRNSLYMRGAIYVLVTVRGSITDAEMLILERFVAALTGPVFNSLKF